MKKNLLLCVEIILSAFLSVLIFYPLLHEAGHILPALFFGGEISSVTLFPLPSAVCNIKNTGVTEQKIISLGGIFLPFFSAVIPPLPVIFPRLVSFFMRFTVLLSFLLNTCFSILFFFGIYDRNEDIVRVLLLSPGGELFYSLLFSLLSALVFLMIIKSHNF